MPKPDYEILLRTLIRVAKEQQDLSAANSLLQVLSETAFEVEDNAPLVEAYHDIKDYFLNRPHVPLVQMNVEHNTGDINAMERCLVTTRIPNYYTDANNNPKQLRAGQSH